MTDIVPITEDALAAMVAEIEKLREIIEQQARRLKEKDEEIERLTAVAQARGDELRAAGADVITALRAALSAIGNNATEADEPRGYARRVLELSLSSRGQER